MSARKEICRIFDTLNDWRHLPAYQLERRVDLFFAIYLPYALEARRCVKIKEGLVPEFPIKKKGNNRSEKADYLAISKDGDCIFLIELKTDMNSDCIITFSQFADAIEGRGEIARLFAHYLRLWAENPAGSPSRRHDRKFASFQTRKNMCWNV